MPGFKEEDVHRNDSEDLDFDLTINDEVVFDALIDAMKSLGYDDIVEALQAAKRTYTIKNNPPNVDGMVGAKVTYVDGEGQAYRALVIEPDVGNDLSYLDEVYDSNKDEYVDPTSYPFGTAQLIRQKDGEFGEDAFFSRPSDLVSETSVPPATHPQDKHCYFAGWDYYDNLQSEEDSS